MCCGDKIEHKLGRNYIISPANSANLVVFAFLANLSAENSKLSAESGLQGQQLLECMFFGTFLVLLGSPNVWSVWAREVRLRTGWPVWCRWPCRPPSCNTPPTNLFLYISVHSWISLLQHPPNLFLSQSTFGCGAAGGTVLKEHCIVSFISHLSLLPRSLLPLFNRTIPVVLGNPRACLSFRIHLSP